MWMTSSFRANWQSLGRLLAGSAFLSILLSGSGLASAQDVPPDAPRPARAMATPATKQTRPPLFAPVEIKKVTVSRVDATSAKLAGEEFMRTAENPLVIEVQTVDPLQDLTHTSSPVIEVNGETLSETIPVGPNRLVAFLPDRKSLREVNSVSVVWLGRETTSRSKRALTFRSADIK